MNDVAGHILLLSGHPGSGKTTTAEALAHLPGAPKVHLHSDDFWGFIKHGHIDPWLEQADQQNQMIMQIAADVAGRYASHGYFVVLDGVVRPGRSLLSRLLACPFTISCCARQPPKQSSAVLFAAAIALAIRR